MGMMKSLTLEKGSIKQIVQMAQEIPEFTDPVLRETIEARLVGVPHLILIAQWNSQLAGFKVGYERKQDGSFYSWIGAVLPAYRKKGIALALAERQEAWALSQGYQCIRFKTRNAYKAMQIFAISRGFDIIGHEPKEDRSQDRIWMEKKLR